MTSYVFAPDKTYALPVLGQEAEFPIHRIFCVGRNYAAHAAEMGAEVDREAPFYFTKTPSAMALSGQPVAYPSGTQDYHHEIELALMIGAPAFCIKREQAEARIYGYACALDMTRRDLQQIAKDKRRPWDLGKDVEQSAIFAPITTADRFRIEDQSIQLAVNGTMRQQATLDEMIWKADEIIADLSRYYHLRPGDVILTGTPAGVGAVAPGDQLEGRIEGLAPLSVTID